MPNLDGIEATRAICGDDDLTAVRVLILTTCELDENVLRALRAGASGFLGKGTRPAELLAAIRTIAAGEALLTQTLIGRYLAGPGTDRPTAADHINRAMLKLSARDRAQLVVRAFQSGLVRPGTG